MAGKLGLNMSYIKTETMSIGRATSVSKVRSFLECQAESRIGKASRQHPESFEIKLKYTRCGEIVTSSNTPSWNFTMPASKSASFPHFCMHVWVLNTHWAWWGQTWCLRHALPVEDLTGCMVPAYYKQLHKIRTKQPQFRAGIGNATFSGLVIYKEWTWTVSPTSCTIRNHPTEKEDLADQRHHGERSSRNYRQQQNGPGVDCWRGRGCSKGADMWRHQAVSACSSAYTMLFSMNGLCVNYLTNSRFCVFIIVWFLR